MYRNSLVKIFGGYLGLVHGFLVVYDSLSPQHFRPKCTKTENLEEHHVNPVRNIKGKGLSEYKIWLRKKQRQTITLCREHHLEAEKLYRQKK